MLMVSVIIVLQVSLQLQLDSFRWGLLIAVRLIPFGFCRGDDVCALEGALTGFAPLH